MLQWIGVTSKYLIPPNRAVPLGMALSGFLVYGEISVNKSPFSLSGSSLIFSVFGSSEVVTPLCQKLNWYQQMTDEHYS
jgi:hypothetical protein